MNRLVELQAEKCARCELLDGMLCSGMKLTESEVHGQTMYVPCNKLVIKLGGSLQLAAQRDTGLPEKVLSDAPPFTAERAPFKAEGFQLSVASMDTTKRVLLDMAAWYREGIRVKYLYMPFFYKKPWAERAALLEDVTDRHIVCIDRLDSVEGSDREHAIVRDMVEYRKALDLPTIVTVSAETNTENLKDIELITELVKTDAG